MKNPGSFYRIFITLGVVAVIYSVFYIFRGILPPKRPITHVSELKSCETGLESYKPIVSKDLETIIINKYNFQINYPEGITRLNKEPSYTEDVAKINVEGLTDQEYVIKYQPHILAFGNGKYILQVAPLNTLPCSTPMECAERIFKETVGIAGNQGISVCSLGYQTGDIKFYGTRKFAQNQFAIRLQTVRGGNLYEISYAVNTNSESELQPILDSDLQTFVNFVSSFRFTR